MQAEKRGRAEKGSNSGGRQLGRRLQPKHAVAALSAAVLIIAFIYARYSARYQGDDAAWEQVVQAPPSDAFCNRLAQQASLKLTVDGVASLAMTSCWMPLLEPRFRRAIPDIPCISFLR